jgi:CheY-like chemotaxis protein
MRTGGHILVVDDDDIVRSSMARLLRLTGYDVSTAIDGLDALAQLRAGPAPCLILLDLQMPVMDGFTFRVQQQLDSALANIPVVLMSAAPNLSEEAIRLGVAGFVQKPVDVAEVMEIVGRHGGVPVGGTGDASAPR